MLAHYNVRDFFFEEIYHHPDNFLIFAKKRWKL